MIKDLDRVFKAATPGTMIQLESGIYTTIGCDTDDSPDSNVLKLGCSVFGSKEGRTTIICTRPLTEDGGDVSVIRGEGNNTVANVTVDGGVPYTDQVATPWPRKRNLVFLHGGSNKIIDVTGRRQYGIFPNSGQPGRESFGLSAWSVGGASKIIGCNVEECVGNYSTAIQAYEISDCKVTFPRAKNGVRNFRAAYNMGDTVDGFVRNCEAYWAMAGVYMDWMSCLALRVENCNFVGCEVGLWINAQQNPGTPENRIISDLFFRKNSVILDPGAKSIQGVLIDHGHSDGRNEEVTMHCVQNVLVEENLFDFLPGEAIKAESKLAANIYCLTPASKHSDGLGVRNVRFVNNISNPLLGWRLKGEAEVDGYTISKIKWTS